MLSDLGGWGWGWAVTHGMEGWKRQTPVVLGAARPKGTPRNVPSRTAVLLRIRLSGCNKGPHSRVANGLASLTLGLEADSPGLVQEDPVPDALSSQRSWTN